MPHSVADPGFGQGGARIFFRDFADIAKQSQVSKVSNIIFQQKNLGILTKLFFFWFADTLICKPGGLGPTWAQEAVTFLTSKYVSSNYPEHFLLTFQNNFM